jgi:hypothetical protein
MYYNAQHRAVICDRYQQGYPLHDIARISDRIHITIQGLIARKVGVKPSDKTRSTSYLKSQKREEISRGLSSQLSIRVIAKQLNRAPPEVSREENSSGDFKHIEQINPTHKHVKVLKS